MIAENFIKIFENSFRENWSNDALEDYLTGNRYTYGEMAHKIAYFHTFFDKLLVKEGDKIAVCGKNSSSWIIGYMSVVTYGAVVVPILDEFTPTDIVHIINHSESSLLFIDEDVYNKLLLDDLSHLKAVVSLNSFSLVYSKDDSVENVFNRLPKLLKHKYGDRFSARDIKYNHRHNSKLAAICYTAGTVSFTKGVMLSGNNIASNIVFALDIYAAKGVKLNATLVILPLAHAYATAFDLLTHLSCGAKVVSLGKVPSPNILVKASREVKPKLLFLVPLVLEKIYKVRVEPLISKPLVAWAIKQPIIGDYIYKIIGRKIYKALGGNAEDIIVGGASMNPDIEKFLFKAKLPFTIGYGMTECAPLISYAPHSEFVPTSVGKILDGLMEIKIDNHSDQGDIGEILVKGEHVMMGYYKDESATEATFTDDGWFKTGDLGYIDDHGNIYIKGRSKTMFLSSNGENIYPETIESKLSNMPFVNECIILQENKRLVAYVYPDLDMIDKMGVKDIAIVMNDNKHSLNSMLSRNEKIHTINILSEPLPKTPKKTVKRLLAEQQIMGNIA